MKRTRTIILLVISLVALILLMASVITLWPTEAEQESLVMIRVTYYVLSAVVLITGAWTLRSG